MVRVHFLQYILMVVKRVYPRCANMSQIVIMCISDAWVKEVKVIIVRLVPANQGVQGW